MVIVGVVIGIAVLAALVLAAISVRIVREYQRIVLFRLGRAIGIRGPGLVLVNPITDRTSWVDLREQFLEIPHQTAITKDNASISIDFIIFYKVVDSEMSVLRVQTSPTRPSTWQRRRYEAWWETWPLMTCSPDAKT